MKRPVWKQSALAAVGALAFVGAIRLGLAQSEGDLYQPGPGDQPGIAASPSPTDSPTAQPGASSNRVVYQATLNPVNGSGATGTAIVVVEGDQAGIFLQAFGLEPGFAHAQHIHSGTACATATNDTNGDGFIDGVESEAVAGPPVVPLTLGLGQQPANAAASATEFPLPAADGNLTYIGTFPVSSIPPVTTPAPQPGATATPEVSPTATPSPTDAAGQAGDSSLNGRVINIHGFSPNAQFPSTVAAGSSGLPIWQEIPVSCGVLQRIQE